MRLKSVEKLNYYPYSIAKFSKDWGDSPDQSALFMVTIWVIQHLLHRYFNFAC